MVLNNKKILPLCTDILNFFPFYYFFVEHIFKLVMMMSTKMMKAIMMLAVKIKDKAKKQQQQKEMPTNLCSIIKQIRGKIVLRNASR